MSSAESGVQVGKKEYTLDDILDETRIADKSEGIAVLDEYMKQVRHDVDDELESVTLDKRSLDYLEEKIQEYDKQLSIGLAEVMHHSDFRKLEGTWRGLHYLVDGTLTGPDLQIKALHCTKDEVRRDLKQAGRKFQRSETFGKIYKSEFDQAGGDPFGALIGDFEFTKQPTDFDLLQNISKVAAASFCPFLSAASPGLFSFKKWGELEKAEGIDEIFQGKEYIDWQEFRKSEDARFVALTMPRTLARRPFGSKTEPVEEFNYEETISPEGVVREVIEHDEYCWMNTSYVLGLRLTEAFRQTGFCTRIRGREGGGGLVEGLPTHVYKSEDGDLVQKCPTEVQIDDTKERTLSGQGFLPLIHYKNKNYAVFFGGQTTQDPVVYYDDLATENAQISTRLPYILAASRFTHYLKCMVRDWVGTFKEESDLQRSLSDWIHNYVSKDPSASEEVRAKYPLKEANVEVTPIPGQSGHYNAVFRLIPWLQLEEMTASVRMVARLPEKKT